MFTRPATGVAAAQTAGNENISHFIFLFGVYLRGAVRAALCPGVGANVALGQVPDEAQQPQAPIGSPGTILHKLDMLTDSFEAKELEFELRSSVQRDLVKFVGAPLWYPTQPLACVLEPGIRTAYGVRQYRIRRTRRHQPSSIVDLRGVPVGLHRRRVPAAAQSSVGGAPAASMPHVSFYNNCAPW